MQIQQPPPVQANASSDRSARQSTDVPADSSDPAPQSADTQAPAATQGRDPDLIYAGETIKLADGSTYTVKSGDTLSSIARATGASVDDLIAANGMNGALTDGNPYTSGAPQVAPGTTTVDKATPPTAEPVTQAPTEQRAAIDTVSTDDARKTVALLVSQKDLIAEDAQAVLDALDRVDSGNSTAQDEELIRNALRVDVLPASPTGVKTDVNENSAVTV
jgi:LysM repeat protein